MSSVQVGLFTSVRSFIGIFAPILWGLLCDRFHTVKKVFLACLLGVILLYPTVPLFENIPLGMLTMAAFMTVLARLFYRPLGYLFTSWMVQMQDRLPGLEYGKIRVVASIASVVAGVAFSFLIAYFGTVRVGYFGGGLAAVLVLITMRRLPDIRPEDALCRTSLKSLKIGRILKNPLLMILFLVMTAVIVGTATVSVYLPYLLDEIGAHVSIIGVYNTLRALSGIPMVYLSGRILRRFGMRRVLTICYAMEGIGQLIFALAGSAGVVIGMGLVLGFTSGLMMVSQALYAQELAPPQLRNTVQMLISTILALSTVITGVLGGPIIALFGVRIYFGVTFGIAGLAVLGFAAANKVVIGKQEPV